MLVRFCIHQVMPLNPQYLNVFKLFSIIFYIVIFTAYNQLSTVKFVGDVDFSGDYFALNKMVYYLLIVLSITLPSLVVIALNRLLFYFQPRTEFESEVLNEIEFVQDAGELSKKIVPMRMKEQCRRKVIVYVSKWIGHQANDFYHISINNTVVCSLRVNEYAEITINKNENILGCYAIPTIHSNSKYRYSYMSIRPNEYESDLIEIRQDMIFGVSFHRKGVSRLRNRIDNLMFAKSGLMS